MSLKEILDQIKVKKAEANLPLELADFKTRGGMEGVIRAAQAELVKLEEEYKQTAIKNSVLIGVVGPGAKQFADVAEKEFSTISVDFKSVLPSVVEGLARRRAGDTFVNSTNALLMAELNEVKVKYRIAFLPAPTVDYVKDGVYGAPMAVAIENVFNKNYGNSLYSAVTVREIGERALAANFKFDVVPVVLYNFTGNDPQILSAPSEVVEVPENPSIEFVQEVLVNIKNKIKKQRRK